MRPARLAFIVALALVGPVCFVAIGDSDAGWHLALGRLIATQGLPHTNALTWTARDVPWYDTSWLWDLATYLLTARIGLIGLQLATLAALAAALWALCRACAARDERGPWVVPAIALLLLPRIVVRPHLATFAAVASVLALCLLAEKRGPALRAACLPIVAFAINLHSGATFAAGLLGLFCLQAFAQRRRPVELAIGAGAVLALCANPGGLYDLRSMFFHLSVQQVVVIAEYLPPTLQGEPVFFVLLPLALVLAWRRRRESPAHLAALFVFGALALRAVRMAYEFEIIAAPALADGLALLRARFGTRAQVAALIAGTLLCGASHRWDAHLLHKRYAPDWDASALPVRAAAFARNAALSGPAFNAYDYGGYFEWALPEVPAFVDGRVQCFPADFFPRFYAASHSPHAFQDYLRGLGVEWALTSRASPWLSGHGLLATPGWALVYWDDLSEVWLRRDVARFANTIAALEYRHFAPRGSIVGNIAATPRAELENYLAEVTRYQATSPDDPFAALVRCGVRTRAANAQAPADCTRAESLAESPAMRALLERARALPVAP